MKKLFILLILSTSLTTFASTWDCTSPDKIIGDYTYPGSKISFEELDSGEFLINKNLVKKPILNEYGIVLFVSTSNHEGFSARIYGFMDKGPRITMHEGESLDEIDFKDPLIKEMLSAPNDVGVYVEQWLPVHNHSRIGKSKKTGYGVYANAPFEFETEYGICIKS